MLNTRKLFYLVILFMSCNTIISNNSIYGQWIGKYNNHEFIIIFRDNNECFMKYFNNDTNRYVVINGDYELDFSKNPIPLKIKNIQEMKHPLYSIIEYISNNSIKISKFYSKWKLSPVSFKVNETLILNRVSIK